MHKSSQQEEDVVMSNLIVVFLVLFLSACVFYPNVPYREMDGAIANAETPEEKAFYVKQLARFERDVIRADALIQEQQQCKRINGCIWLCVYHGPQIHRRNLVLDTLEKKVKWYRRMRGSCGPQFGKVI